MITKLTAAIIATNGEDIQTLTQQGHNGKHDALIILAKGTGLYQTLLSTGPIWETKEAAKESADNALKGIREVLEQEG